MMEPRLRKRVPEREERMAMLKNVFCEANRSGEVRTPPGLVMAIIDIESSFNRYAVSYAGAVGLMQVMPFWPETLGMRRHQLTKVPENIRMGCAIFRAYLKRENNNIARALARYNGSTGKRWYSDKVIAQWTRWNGADDLGRRRASGRSETRGPLNRARVDLGRLHCRDLRGRRALPQPLRRKPRPRAPRRRPALPPCRRRDCVRTP